MRRQIGAQCFCFSRDLSELERAGVSRASRNRVAQLLLCGLPKTRQFSDTPLLTRLLQLLDRANAELIVKSFYFLCAKTGQREQLHDPSRKSRAQLFQVFE